MRLAIISGGLVVNVCEGELAVVRALYPAADVVPIDDRSAAQPGAAAVVLRRTGGVADRCRFTRAEGGYQTTETNGARE